MTKLLDIDEAGKDDCLKNSEEPWRQSFNEERTSIASITSETICFVDRRCERVRHREPGTAGTPHPGPHGVSRYLGIDGRTARRCKPWYIEILIANALQMSSPVSAQETYSQQQIV